MAAVLHLGITAPCESLVPPIKVAIRHGFKAHQKRLVMFATTRHMIREVGPPQPAESTLRDRAGSCRDLAVLFCAACRAVGLAARFVSGYERDASLQENGDLHAWAEVYLEGAGWRGYDPSRALAVAASHVAVAASSDPLLASPVSGTFRGSATAKMEFSISMQVE